MVELTLPIVLQILQTIGLFVGVIYYITIMKSLFELRAHIRNPRLTPLFFYLEHVV